MASINGWIIFDGIYSWLAVVAGVLIVAFCIFEAMKERKDYEKNRESGGMHNPYGKTFKGEVTGKVIENE